MDTLRIISIALLAGCSAAGLVWYIWGIRTNVSAYRKQRHQSVPAMEPGESGDDEMGEKPDA